MANATILGAPRLSLGATVAGNNPVGMPATNLNNDEPSEKCRMDSTDPAITYIYVPQLSYPLGYYGATFGVGGIGVVNHNLSIGATARTLLLDADAADFIPERITPNAVTVTLGSWTGAVTDVDESPYATDANNLLLTDDNGNIRFDFLTPSANPKTGTDVQMFRLVISYVNHPDAIVFQLFEGGVFRRTLDVILPAGGDPELQENQVLFVPWDASDLTTADGSNVQFVVAINQDAGDDFAIEAVDWLCEPTLSAGSILYDSGWETATYDVTDSLWGDTVAGAAGISPTQNYVHYPATEVTGVAQAVTFFRDPFNTSGYVDVGCYVLGPRFRPTINRAWGPLVGVRDLSVKKFSHGGQTFGVKRPRLRTISLPMHELSAAEAHSVLDRVNWRKGTLSPVLVSLFPGDATEGRHTTIWATVEQMDDMAANFFGDFRAMNLTFVEKL